MEPCLSEEVIKSLPTEALIKYRNSLRLQMGNLAAFLTQLDTELTGRAQDRQPASVAS